MALTLGIFLAFLMPLEWVAAGKHWVKVRYVTKPLSLLFLLLIFIKLGGWVFPGYWFGIGLIFSLMGDIFLLMRARFFIPGLFAFLVAHICYIIGFSWGSFNPSVWLVIPFVVVVLLILVAYPRIIGGVRRRLQQKRLWLPVVLYMVTITVMLLMAMLTWFRPEWSGIAAFFASFGALLFTASDSLLATGRFLRPVPYGNFLVMFTYHLGQVGIMLGTLVMLGKLSF